MNTAERSTKKSHQDYRGEGHEAHERLAKNSLSERCPLERSMDLKAHPESAVHQPHAPPLPPE